MKNGVSGGLFFLRSAQSAFSSSNGEETAMSNNAQELWTVEEFAQYVKVTPGAARAMIRRDQVPQEAVLRIGRRVRLRAEVIKAWIAKQVA